MSKRAFTLIELLIVVAIIGIVAAISVPNFMNARIRASIARVEAEEYTIALALELYRADYNSLPPVRATQSTRYMGYRYLTTPIAFLDSILHDPFRKRFIKGFGSNGYDQYYEFAVQPWPSTLSHNTIFAIESVGPDQVDSLATNTYPSHSDRFEFYDPSNGLTSSGDLLRAGGVYLPKLYRERKGGPSTTGQRWI